ncbi:MAG: serine/threonine protein kinase, partial [Actinomycetia bacterium]|nr:serine/threonine protein kinase [Actinomycetes bacterium]
MADDIDRRLQEELHVVDLDNQYTVEEILREGATGRTERVHAPDGTILIRKYLKRGATQGNEYALLLGLQGAPFPRIIVLYELADWQVVIMEYLDGPTLQKCVEMQGPFPPDQAVLLALGVCHAAQVLHTSGPNLIIHRDIKPDNIILQNGYVKLIDFGIARQFKAGEDHDTEYLGTRGYAAPEQFGYSQTDARTDIYAIGATLYFLLTGERFEAQRRTALASMSWIPADLARIIYRCTEFSPEARYQTAGELMGELQKARVTASVTATPQALPTAVLPAPAKAAKRGVTDRAGQFRDTKTFRVLRVIWVVAVNIVFWPFFL